MTLRYFHHFKKLLKNWNKWRSPPCSELLETQAYFFFTHVFPWSIWCALIHATYFYTNSTVNILFITCSVHCITFLLEEVVLFRQFPLLVMLKCKNKSKQAKTLNMLITLCLLKALRPGALPENVHPFSSEVSKQLELSSGSRRICFLKWFGSY